jgi:SAM-dependent methyltransferase
MDLEAQKPHSVACDRNQGPIGDELERIVHPGDLIWEIASGTGQHAVYFGARFGDIVWQPSDRDEMHPGIRMWLEEAALPNVREVLSFDLFDSVTPVTEASVVFCANTIHIAPWEAGQRIFGHAARALKPGGMFVVYGPYRYADRPLEPSNEKFDQWLKSVDPARGIRLFEEVQEYASAAGFELVEDIAMPANNRLIRWVRR